MSHRLYNVASTWPRIKCNDLKFNYDDDCDEQQVDWAWDFCALSTDLQCNLRPVDRANESRMTGKLVLASVFVAVGVVGACGFLQQSD